MSLRKKILMQKFSHYMICVVIPANTHSCWKTKINYGHSKLFVLLFLSFSVINNLSEDSNSILRMLNTLVIRALQNNIVNRIAKELSDIL